jgi:hypothetical protein
MSGPGPGIEGTVTVNSGMQRGAEHDNLEDVYAGADSFLDTTAKEDTGDVVEDDPLAEFEAWIASGAVQIVDKL